MSATSKQHRYIENCTIKVRLKMTTNFCDENFTEIFALFGVKNTNYIKKRIKEILEKYIRKK